MSDRLQVGDVIVLRHGPFASDWKVVKIAVEGATLEWLPGHLALAGFVNPITTPNGTQLTGSVQQEFLGRAHFGAAQMLTRVGAAWAGHQVAGDA